MQTPAAAEDAPEEDIAKEPAQVSIVHSPLKKLPSAALVLRHVLHSDTRGTLVKLTRRRAGPIWSLLVESIESGAFGPPTRGSIQAPTLRLILPWVPQSYAKRYDVRKSADQETIRRDVLPTVVQHRERLLREPDALPGLVNETYVARRAGLRGAGAVRE